MQKIEYDFLIWRSFPSSIKLINDEPERYVYAPWGLVAENIPVMSGATLKIECQVKQENVIYGYSHLPIHGFDGKEWKWIKEVRIPKGTFDWSTQSLTISVPSGITLIRVTLAGGAGTPASLGITWFDDLKVYMDDELVYDNYFTALRPGKVVPVIWTPPERIIGAYQRRKQGEKALIFKPPRLLQTVKV